MRLNWFSPLPPARTGIASYTRQLLPALIRRAEVILWTDQPDWDPTLENYAEVRHYELDYIPWAELNRGDLSIYHIGNNPLFHRAIWQVSRQHSGLVVLHDLHLQHFFAGLYRDQWRDRDGYTTEMERHYGPIGLQDAEAFWGGELTTEYMSTHYPLTFLAVEKALGAIAHSAAAVDTLTEECPGPVISVPLPYRASPHPASSHLDAGRKRTDSPPYQLLLFGYLGTNRRLDSLFEALARLPEKDQFRVQIYGQLWDEGKVQHQLRLLGLQDLVTVHGFVPETELDAALEASHLAVNLRYPTMGEASISQLRIWDFGLPSLVTRVGWYASLPVSSVAFVRPASEVDDLQGHLRAFLANPERFVQMGENGRRFLQEHHAPDAYVERLVELAVQLVRYRSSAVVRDLSRRLNTEMARWGDLAEANIESWLGEQSFMDHRPEIASPKRRKRLQHQSPEGSVAISEAILRLLDGFRQQREAMLHMVHQVVPLEPAVERADGAALPMGLDG